jgi:Recombinase
VGAAQRPARRGDGRSARHAVEIALWALKREVRVRTIQDPDTFRDLIYAVVTGQRNHEDSRRKGLASAAGRRRATERGEYTGHKADGYRLAMSIEDGKLLRRLELDPDRRPAIELIFRLGLRGKTSGAIARALNDAGWCTKPRLKGQQPKDWNSAAVLRILHNPRYAGLAATRGEIVGHGHWPTDITVRQHQRLQKLIADRWRRRRKRRDIEAFLLSRIAKCGRCGAPFTATPALSAKTAPSPDARYAAATGATATPSAAMPRRSTPTSSRRLVALGVSLTGPLAVVAFRRRGRRDPGPRFKTGRC